MEIETDRQTEIETDREWKRTGAPVSLERDDRGGD